MDKYGFDPFFDDILDNLNPDDNIDNDASLKISDLNAIDKHNDYYNNFLKEYVNNFISKNKNQRIMKWFFFGIIMTVMLVIIIGSVWSLYLISLNGSFTEYSVIAILSGMTSSIASFIVLPRVIANNLFPKKEDDKTDAIFESMIKYDIALREFYKKDNKK